MLSNTLLAVFTEISIDSEQYPGRSSRPARFFILLRHHLRSSKWIVWDDIEKKFYIHNLIDDTEQVLTEKQLMDKSWTNIGYAMTQGALYKDE